MVHRLDTTAPGFAAAFAALLAAKRELDDDVDQAVAAILDDVRRRGDDAVIALTRRFDRVELTPATLRVTPDEIASAQRAMRGRNAGGARLRGRAHRRLSPPPDAGRFR